MHHSLLSPTKLFKVSIICIEQNKHRDHGNQYVRIISAMFDAMYQ